jgi:4-amino-4-deoxy-L-arabinose transferase-like glycosyltransferase
MGRAPLIAVLAAGFLVFTVNLGGYDLWPPDEPRFGQVAREMMQSGNLIQLTINGETYREKPPFLFWLIALASLPFGDVTETTARAPSVVAALIALYFTYRLGLRMFGARVGLCAGFVLLTSLLFWWEARSVRTDMLLTACLSVALYAFWMHHETRSRNGLLIFYAAIIAAVYAKGPPGLVFPLLLAITFYWGRREQRRELRLGWGVLAVLGAVAVWLVPAYTLAPASVEQAPSLGLSENLFRQTIGRFVLGVSKAQPPYYYFVNLPASLFPWTLFLPWVIYFAWKRRREGDAMRLLLCWIVPAIVFFSIGSGKRAVYLLPLFPAFAVLIAYALVELMDAPNRAWMRRTVGTVWSVLLLAVGGFFPVLAYFAWFDTTLHPDLGAFIPPLAKQGISIDYPTLQSIAVFTGCAMVFALHAVYAAIRRQGRSVHFAMAGHFAGLGAVAVTLLFPAINTHKGASDFCGPLRRLTENGVEYRLYSVAFSREEYIFYTKHHHRTFLVDTWPGELPEGIELEEYAAEHRALQSALQRAVEGVPIADWSAITDEELGRLQHNVDAVFELAKAKTDHVQLLRDSLVHALKDFEDELSQPGPAFVFVQQQNWPWLLALHPSLRKFHVLDQEPVGSRRVLIVGNDEGATILVGTGEQASIG